MEILSQLCTKKHDENVCKMATELQDNKLLAKISSGDVVATDDNY